MNTITTATFVLCILYSKIKLGLFYNYMLSIQPIQGFNGYLFNLIFASDLIFSYCLSSQFCLQSRMKPASFDQVRR